MGRFRGFTLYVGMLSAPLVIPEVVLGISLLLMFVELRGHLGWPAENGMFTIWVGHVTLCMAFVAVVIQTRIRDLDRSLEEAALDLGATPLVVFFKITLPLIAPALASAGCCRSRCRWTTWCWRPFCRAPAPARCRWKCSRACGWA